MKILTFDKLVNPTHYLLKKLCFSPLLLLVLSVLSINALAKEPVNGQIKERIISAGSSVTELFLALEATDQLVAVDLSSRSLITSPSIEQVGYHRQLSAEGLMALNPTRLIGSNEMGPETTLQLLAASQVDVVTVPSGNSVEDLYQRIDIIAKLTNTQANVAPLKQKIATSISLLKNKPLSKRPKVLFLMVSKDRPATVAGNDTPVDTIIKLAGGSNPAALSVNSYKPLSYEAIITMAPDYILVSERAWQKFHGKEGLLKQLPLLNATAAGQHGNILSIPSSAIIGGFGIESIEFAKQLNQLFTQ